MTQQNPPLLPSAPASHQVAGQSHQHRGPGVNWLIEHAITAHSATPSMARPCTSHGAWPPAKRNPLWRTVGGHPSRGSTTAALHGRHQVRLDLHQTNLHQVHGRTWPNTKIRGSKVSKLLLFADDAALTFHSEEGLQHLVDKEARHQETIIFVSAGNFF